MNKIVRASASTSTFTSALIWFGAAVSIAEILTGMLIAPLGLAGGLGAILLGHLIGGIPLLLAGLIGAQTGQNAMGTVKRAFGFGGGALFSLLNVVQLVGWTAVMIAAGAAVAQQVFALAWPWLWPAIIAALIIVWITVGNRGLTILSVVSVMALLVLSVMLSLEVFAGALPGLGALMGGGAPGTAAAEAAGSDVVAAAAQEAGGISFGTAVELSAAMPLSWLPLISDYTRRAAHKTASPVVSVATYSLVSCWMFSIGLGVVLFTQADDLAAVFLASGLGLAALFTAVLSTTTTTFLDANSAGESASSIFPRVNAKAAACVACLLGLVIALVAPSSSYEEFLYLIGSVFAPMSAVQIVDYFILKNDSSAKPCNVTNLAVWAVGFVGARLLVGSETVIGISLPVMLACAALALLVAGARRLLR
ncbi:MAG: cytosine permease [Coriobacteriales bacterium]|jgi:purine-cytosine permease-like protein|nr:cytosine permease [Coriobacteriales bacterium]